MRFVLTVFAFVLALIGPGSVLAQNVKTYIPERAKLYLLTVDSDARRLMPEMLTPWYFGGLIEHESCISLTHSRCWSPTSELKTSREQGTGFGQITRAWAATGKLRFDNLEEMRRRYPNELGDLSWTNVKQRPDLQIRAIVLQIRANHLLLQSVPDPYERMAMADAAYNGGMSGLDKERRSCGMTKGCDPNVWFGNVENVKLKSTAALYGQRSAWDINRNHPQDVLKVRMAKYEPYFK